VKTAGERWGRVLWQGRTWSVQVTDQGLALYNGNWWQETVHPTGVVVSAEQVTWLMPTEPRNILCVGRNYRAHAAELGNQVPDKPLFFLKPVSAGLGHRGIIRRPTGVGRVDYEGELVVVIGRRLARGASPADIKRATAGITVSNDVTARDLQRTDGQWTRAKGFDTFAPVGPWVTLGVDWRGRTLETTVNGAVRQQSSTDAMIFDVETLLWEASRFMTMEPGDLLFTGTPEGIGALDAGDEVSVTIQGVGTLSNLVKNEE